MKHDPRLNGVAVLAAAVVVAAIVEIEAAGAAAVAGETGTERDPLEYFFTI